MASDAALPVNGIYGGQYDSPAELPAPTPSASHAPSASQSTTASAAAAPKADPQEIGWYFVEQYYTTLSKNPERIHLFYAKKSQLVIGVEAEKVVPAVGVKAIGEKIKELDIQDCKVRVLNVDSQASFQNIVVQVIGEMSNKSEPHHKFVQTFVLAEQPNGFYVLNDIFRYLNEDEDVIVDDHEAAEQEVAQEEQSSPAIPVQEVEHSHETVTDEAAAEQVDRSLEEVAKAEKQDPAPGPNGISDTVALEKDAHAEEDEQMPTSTKEMTEDTHKSPSAAGDDDPAVEESVPALEPTPARSPKPAEPNSVLQAAPAKKTWANMVGAKALALPATPVSSVPSTASQPRVQKSAQTALPQSTSGEAAPATVPQGNGWQMAEHSKKQSRPQARSGNEQVLAYIKNVTEKIPASDLRAALEQFGELKYFDVSRPKNCAFVEFADAAAYNATVAANPHTFGSEQIYVEERRPKNTAYGGGNASFGRGGGTAGRGRGGMPGRTGSQGGTFPRDASRGNYQQRGNRSGNVTPRGRGQPQAA